MPFVMMFRNGGIFYKLDATDVSVHPSPTRSAIFNAGVTSRVNVAHFMADLICDDPTWNKWKGKMPVIYNLESCASTEKHACKSV